MLSILYLQEYVETNANLVGTKMPSLEHLHLAGGYFISRVIDRPTFISGDLMPDRILSASECLVSKIPDFWWLLVDHDQSGKDHRKEQNEMSEEIKTYGLDPSIAPELISWMDVNYDRKEFGWRAVFLSLKLAREFIGRFHPHGKDLVLFGVGLHRELLDVFRKDVNQSRQWELGVAEMIRRNIPPDSGDALGYEILCYDNQTFAHSWLCKSLEVESFKRFGVRPNPHGFIEDFESAKRIAEYWNSDQLEPQDQPEPGLWLPWLITRYKMS